MVGSVNISPLFPYAAATGDVTVRVAVSYQAETSEPAASRWFWVYHIRIENHGTMDVQLIDRHWQITDGRGTVHLVEGSGVFGEQPVIAPGGSYDYVSGCPLATPSGRMIGSYGMMDEHGRRFAVAIPEFPLLDPVLNP